MRYLQPVLAIGTTGAYIDHATGGLRQFFRLITLGMPIFCGRDHWLQYTCDIWSRTKAKFIKRKVPACCLTTNDDMLEPRIGPTPPIGSLMLRAVSSFSVNQLAVFASCPLKKGWALFWRTGTCCRRKKLPFDPELFPVAIRNGSTFITPGAHEWKSRWSRPFELGFGWRVRMHDRNQKDANLSIEVQNGMPYLRVLNDIGIGVQLICHL